MTDELVNQLIKLNPDASIKDLIDFVSMEKELREFEIRQAKIKQTAQEFEVLNLKKLTA